MILYKNEYKYFFDTSFLKNNQEGGGERYNFSDLLLRQSKECFSAKFKIKYKFLKELILW